MNYVKYVQRYELLQIKRMFVCLQGFHLFIFQPSITMASQLLFLFMLSSLNSVYGLPEYCYNYYSEFALDEHYNPAIYPEINTTITDITTLYKVSEVGLGRSVNREGLICSNLLKLNNGPNFYYLCIT